MSNEPTLSVVIPVYNGSKYVRDALDSVVRQTRIPDEIVVVDDGSTDDSVAIVEEYIEKHRFIRLYRNHKNMGVMYTENRGAHLSSGDYLFFLSCDDYILPPFCEKMLAAAAAFPDARLITSDALFVDVETSEFRRMRLDLSAEMGFLDPDKFFGRLNGNPQSIDFLPGHASVIRRDAFAEGGGFIEELRWHCDWFLWLVIAFRYGLAVVPDGMSVMRVRADSYSRAARIWERQKQVIAAVMDLLMNPQFRDVLPRFVESGVFAHFGHDLFRLVAEEPRYRFMLSPGTAARIARQRP